MTMHVAQRVNLHNGDRMTRQEFHDLYESTPDDFRAELIDGTVFIPPPHKVAHGALVAAFAGILALYQAHTPGVEAVGPTTLLLGDHSEPQPDACLRIHSELGGRSRITDDDYLAGPPELILEAAYSRRSIDLHAKRKDYALHGVLEYVVLCIENRQGYWFDFRADRKRVDHDGLIRPHTFPGLWIDVAAIFDNEYNKLIETVRRGLSASEHARFVERLSC